MKFLLRISAVLVLAAIAGCVTVSPGEPESEVLSKLGRPTHRYQDGNDQLLEYAYGPFGQQTYMARIGPDGKLISYEQVLTTQRFGMIKIGESNKTDVLKLVGAPSETSYLPLRDLEVWTYPYKEAGAWDSLMNVEFDRTGIVRDMVNAPDLRYDPDRRFPFAMFHR
jgi:hypothetical protein